jgi:outer membrane protein
MKLLISILALIITLFSPNADAQSSATDTALTNATLQQCIHYALAHQPLIRQSQVDEEIAETNIRTSLSAWYPQVNAAYNLQRSLLLPTLFIPDVNGVKRAVQTGVKNTSNIQLSVNQTIFNSELLLARQTAGDVRNQARQVTASNKIDVVVNVSKAYYNLLLSQQQVKVLDENILRQERSLRDAYNQYLGGIVDKIDYKREQISLNNTKAERKRAQEQVEARYATLRQLMGYRPGQLFSVVYDSMQMERNVLMDTMHFVSSTNRIEYKILTTQRSLLQANVKYYRNSYLPTVSAFGNYIPTFQNDRFVDLYDRSFPTSVIGLQVSLPIFQGFRRIHNIRSANLQLNRLQWDIQNLENAVNAEYEQALAAYKGNLAQYQSLKENLALAEDVYNTLRLQYSAGIKTYLDVIIAETDLRSAQLNYLTALNEVLSSKLDMQRALGTIQY